MLKENIENNPKHFILRRYDFIRPLIDRELVDQEPCFYKIHYGEVDGLKYYSEVIKTSVIEFILYNLEGFGDWDEEREIFVVESLRKGFDSMFYDEIQDYYLNVDCNKYNEQINNIHESMSPEELKRLRRIQEVRNIIEYQTEIQDPCNFDDGEEFADFCIEEGLRFFYGDEGYERDDNVFTDEKEDYLRDEITEILYEEYYDNIIELWNDLKESYEC